MSERICVCGHVINDHPRKCEFDGFCFGQLRGECKCDGWRPVLPWPDAVGLWWCRDGLLPFIGNPTDLEETMCWHMDRWWSHEEFDAEFGPREFAALLEPNPFPSTPPEGTA